MIQCTICPIIKSVVVKYITDTKNFFSKDFITRGYYLHFGCSVVLTFLSMWFLFEYAHLADTGTSFQLFIGAFGAYGANYIKEWIWAKFYGSEWDETDLNFGSYGGIIGALLAIIILL